MVVEDMVLGPKQRPLLMALDIGLDEGDGLLNIGIQRGYGDLAAQMCIRDRSGPPSLR